MFGSLGEMYYLCGVEGREIVTPTSTSTSKLNLNAYG